MTGQKSSLIKDLGIIALSVIVAVVIVKTGLLGNLFSVAEGWKLTGSFVAGIFFVSAFTVAPAAVVLAEIAQHESIFFVAVFGGLGALVGDLIIFKFIKERLLEDFLYLLGKTSRERLKSVFKLKLFRWLIPLFGAIIVASPIPDEIGLAIMGFSKMKTSLFVPVSFLLNFLGILVMGFAVKTLL